MATIAALKGRRAYLDTNIIVYAAEYEIEDVAGELKIAVQHSHDIMVAIDQREIAGVTSELTLAEVLVGALKNNRQRLAAYYRQFLSDDGPIEMLPVSRDIWDYSAQLRAGFLVKNEKLAMPDAIQLAAAIRGRCDLFICNDKKLNKKATATGMIEGWYLGENKD